MRYTISSGRHIFIHNYYSGGWITLSTLWKPKNETSKDNSSVKGVSTYG